MSSVSTISAAVIAAAVAEYRAAPERLVLTCLIDATAAPTQADAALLSFRVPFVSEDGGCSLPDKLQPEPHDTLHALASATLHDGRPAVRDAAFEAVRVRAVRAVCQAVAAATGSQWVGIYERVRVRGEPHDVLAKLQYVGAPSRAFFPLTPDFASHSNNSTVGLSGSAVCIADTDAMGDTPYYTCDGRVRSELCAPIHSPCGVVVGILDAEAWAPGVYDSAASRLIFDVCAQLGETDMLRGLLPGGGPTVE